MKPDRQLRALSKVKGPSQTAAATSGPPIQQSQTALVSITGQIRRSVVSGTKKTNQQNECKVSSYAYLSFF